MTSSPEVKAHFDQWSPEALARRIEEWIAEGGLCQLADAAQSGKEASRQVREAMRADRSTLDKPTTI